MRLVILLMVSVVARTHLDISSLEVGLNGGRENVGLEGVEGRWIREGGVLLRMALLAVLRQARNLRRSLMSLPSSLFPKTGWCVCLECALVGVAGKWASHALLMREENSAYNTVGSPVADSFLERGRWTSLFLVGQ